MILSLLAIGAVGLFSTGPGGRHDWMRFHADEVTCPVTDCPGNLKWFSRIAKRLGELRCDVCLRRFRIKPVVRLGSNGRRA